MDDLFDEPNDDAANGPFYLFLGDADREGVVSQLKTSGARYKRKMLESSVENWRSIFRIFQAEKVAGIIMKLPDYSWHTLLRSERIKMTQRLFEVVQGTPHIIFMHQFFFGIEDRSENQFFYNRLGKNLSENQVRFAKEILSKFDLNIAPYKTNAEMTVLALEFLDQNSRGLVLRLYIPNSRLWGEEAIIYLT